MEYLSERVSVDRSKGRTSVVISARLPKAKEAMLVTWFLAWSICGAYILWEVAHMPPGDQRQYFLVFMAFWTYFAIKIGRSALCRTKGFELVRVKDGVLTLKDSIWGLGKARDHFVENITELGMLNVDQRSWKWQLNESFWVMGGERLGFKHHGKYVAFGKGLTDHEAQQVLRVMKHAMAEARREAGK